MILFLLFECITSLASKGPVQMQYIFIGEDLPITISLASYHYMT